MEFLIAKEAARLYEEQFRTSLGAADVKSAAVSESIGQTQDQESLIAGEIFKPGMDFFLPEDAVEEPFLPPTSAETGDDGSTRQRSMPRRQAIVSFVSMNSTMGDGSRRSLGSTYQEQFLPDDHEDGGEEPFLPLPSENRIEFTEHRRGMPRRPGLVPMNGTSSMPPNSNTMPIGDNDMGLLRRSAPVSGAPTFQSSFNDSNDDGDRRVSFKSPTGPTRSQYDYQPNNTSAGPPYMEWEGRNHDYLADLGHQCKKERRRSSAMVGNYVKLLESLGSSADGEDDDDDFIDARLNQISGIFGNGSQIDRDSVSMDGLATSMRASLTLNEVFGDENDRGKRASFNRSSLRGSSRMSLCSRRSARMSLILRQSCLDSFASESADSGYDEMVEKRHIPDVFSSKRNRRDSIVTPSKAQLVATVFGNEAAKIATASPGTESALLRSALEPVMGDELMVEIGGLGESLDSFAEAMNASQRNIDQLVDASVREEQQRIVNQIRLDSIGSSCCEASAGENPRENDEDEANSDVSNSFFNSSLDLNDSLEKMMRDL